MNQFCPVQMSCQIHAFQLWLELGFITVLLQTVCEAAVVCHEIMLRSVQ